MKFLHPYVMLFLAPLFWATSNVTGKLGKAWLSPYAFTFWRWLLATALLSLLFRRHIRADWPQLKARAGWLFVVGGSGFALFNVVLYGAFARGASVVNVSMITALIPLAVLLVDVGFLRGRAHPLQCLGVALSFVGVLWLVSRGEPLALRRATVWRWSLSSFMRVIHWRCAARRWCIGRVCSGRCARRRRW